MSSCCSHQVTIVETDERFPCTERLHVLQGMASMGRKGIPVGCCGGGCGVCKVQVVSGHFTAARMSRAHVSAEEEGEGIVLACCISPRSDLALRVVGKLKKSLVDRPPPR